MAMNRALVFIVFVGFGLAVWFSVLVLVASHLRSLFRYGLWDVRDALVDDVLTGNLPNSRFAQQFRSMIESVIRNPSGFTFLHFLLAQIRSEEQSTFRVEIEREMQQLDEKQQQCLLIHVHALRRVLAWRLTLGSFSGWFVTVPLLPIFLGVLVYSGVKRAWEMGVRRVLMTCRDYQAAWRYSRRIAAGFVERGGRLEESAATMAAKRAGREKALTALAG